MTLALALLLIGRCAPLPALGCHLPTASPLGKHL